MPFGRRLTRSHDRDPRDRKGNGNAADDVKPHRGISGLILVKETAQKMLGHQFEAFETLTVDLNCSANVIGRSGDVGDHDLF
jgi:hypothetical protein